MAERKQQTTTTTRTSRTVVDQTGKQPTEDRFAGDEGDTMGNPPMDGTGQYLADHEVEELRGQRQEEGARQDAESEAAGDARSRRRGAAGED